MVATRIFEGFSVSHAAILNGTQDAELGFPLTTAQSVDIYGVREASLDVDTDSFDNTGDNTILSTWGWFNFGTLSVTAGYIPFDVVALLTGAVITSSGTGTTDYYNLPLWNESSLNQPTRPVLIRVPSKDSAGTVRDLDIVLYKVQFQPITFNGPTYKDGLVLNYTGKALMSATDEKGTALTDRAIGRLISTPVH